MLAGAEIQFTTGCSYTPGQVTRKIQPGVIVSTGSKHYWVEKIDIVLASGNLILNGIKITQDGFTDGRSRGKTSHYIFINEVTNVIKPDQIKHAFPHCQLRIKN